MLVFEERDKQKKIQYRKLPLMNVSKGLLGGVIPLKGGACYNSFSKVTSIHFLKELVYRILQRIKVSFHVINLNSHNLFYC